MLQGCRLFKSCHNLPARHCVAGVQAVKVVSKPTYWALFCRGAGCLSGVRTYLPDTVLQGCRLCKACQILPDTVLKGAGCLSRNATYLAGTVLQGCRLFKLCRNLPAGHCVAGVQAV